MFLSFVVVWPRAAGGMAVMLWGVMLWSAVVSTMIADVRAADAPSPPMLVDVEQGDGTVTAGRLDRIDAAGVHLADVAGGSLTVPGERVRAVRRTSGQAEGGEKAVTRSRLRLTLVDGSTLAADDFAWQGEQAAVLIRPEGRIELPAGRVRSIAWLPEAAFDAPVPWQGAIPDGTEKDLVVVGTDENHEFVECAITSVSSDAVTVVLDEETIPVKRSKVIGLQWLRNEVADGTVGRALVSVSGGGVRASRVEWSPDAFVIDGDVRLPAAMFGGVDYAAGRTVRLASLTAEQVEVEPWFGGLVPRGGGLAGRADGLAAFFAPRTIESAAGQSRAMKPDGKLADAAGIVPGIIMRPRTTAVWRLPPDSRRFRAVVDAVAGRQAADVTVVAVAVDDRELFRQQVGATGTAAETAVGGEGGGIPIDIDLTNGRRITVTVDFGSGGGVGGAVRFTNPVIER